MALLAHTSRRRVALLRSRASTIFLALNAEVLLLGGSKHPVFLKVDLGTLEKILPHLTCLELRGLGHVAAWSYDRQREPGGQPEPVAQELRRSFAEQ